MRNVIRHGSLFAAMFAVTTTALSYESGGFHLGILGVAAAVASLKYGVAAIHHKVFAGWEAA